MIKGESAGQPVADICMIVEGAFPYVAGGVSSWIMELVGGLPEVSFHIVAIKPDHGPRDWKLKPPANVVGVTEIAVAPTQAKRLRNIPAAQARRLFAAIVEQIERGGAEPLANLIGQLQQLPPAFSSREIMAAPEMFQLLRRFYESRLPESSFHQFFWAWQTLVGGCLAMLRAPLPHARAYHTISTGFAGLYAARARIATGRPMVLTEHGIYQIEREIEITMADWIEDLAGSTLAIDGPRQDLREFWLRAFRSYARSCYQMADPIIALYPANSAIQRRLGAAPSRLKVLPNGVATRHFAALPDRRNPERISVGLIGRVVPIKDILSYIRAAAHVAARHGAVDFFMLGPMEEDPPYAAECKALVAELGLGDRFTFTGRVALDDWLPRLDLIVLTSLSEAQPLVILEAGAAAIPVVASDVGCCRDLLAPDEAGGVPGGIITPLVDPEATARAIASLVVDPARRKAMGRALQTKVLRDFDRETVLAAYRDIYHAAISAPTHQSRAG